MMNKIKNGQTVKVHYQGTFDDGIEFDNSHKRGEPISFQIGSGQMIKGFEGAVMDMSVGETKDVSLTPDAAYGNVNPQKLLTVPKTSFPPSFEFKEGNTVQGKSPDGKMLMGLIREVQDENVVIDANHPLAGRNINFKIELMEVQ
jgi:peptidylprolyl isomerase/FKBP-type peptidyl-prolyl cis-trans isomerase SlpA